MNAVMERTVGNRSSYVKYNNPKQVNRGEVWMVEFDGIGSEQKGIRPALVISNQKGNQFGTTVIVAAVSSQIEKAKLPTHVIVNANNNGLRQTSFIMLEQVRTIDKSRLMYKVAELDHETMEKVKRAHEISCSDMF